MDHRPVDDAIELAIKRTIRAEETLKDTPADNPGAIRTADVVVSRAEDIQALADEGMIDAYIRREYDAGHPAPPPPDVSSDERDPAL
jgi:hypothetical protein